MIGGGGSPLWGRHLARMLRTAKRNPFPGVIGTYMARDALSLAVTHLRLDSDDTVVLPAFLCREVLKPFVERTRVQFYDVSPRLAADPGQIKEALQSSRVRLLLMINYFGFLQPDRREIERMAAERDVVLLEDCAHSLLTEGSGETGGLSVYSFRKVLPVPDGGGLKIRAGGSGGSGVASYPQIYSDALSVCAIVKSLLEIRSETLSRAGLSSGGKARRPGKKDGGKVLPLSSFARNGVGNADCPTIIARRRDDYEMWAKVIRDDSTVMTPIFDELPPGVCPSGFPVRARRRDALSQILQKRGIGAKVQWRLPADVGREFVQSRELSTEILTLPVYPELSQRGRERVDRSMIAECAGELRRKSA